MNYETSLNSPFPKGSTEIVVDCPILIGGRDLSPLIKGVPESVRAGVVFPLIKGVPESVRAGVVFPLLKGVRGLSKSSGLSATRPNDGSVGRASFSKGGTRSYLFSRLFPLSYFLFPLLASAEPIRVFTTPNSDLTFLSFAERLSGIANTIIPFLIGVAFVLVIWGIFKYVRQAGDTEKVAEGRKMLVYGVVALFLMLSFWGFVMIIKNSLFGQ